MFVKPKKKIKSLNSFSFSLFSQLTFIHTKRVFEILLDLLTSNNFQFFHLLTTWYIFIWNLSSKNNEIFSRKSWSILMLILEPTSIPMHTRHEYAFYHFSWKQNFHNFQGELFSKKVETSYIQSCRKMQWIGIDKLTCDQKYYCYFLLW